MSYTSRVLADFRSQPKCRPIPKLSTKPAAYVTGHQYRAKGVPANQQAVYWDLTRQFRAGAIYSFSWDPKAAHWLVWATANDWDATERDGNVRRADLAAAGHGPKIHELAAVNRPKLTKAQLVARLSELDLPAEATRLLELA